MVSKKLLTMYSWKTRRYTLHILYPWLFFLEFVQLVAKNCLWISKVINFTLCTLEFGYIPKTVCNMTPWHISLFAIFQHESVYIKINWSYGVQVVKQYVDSFKKEDKIFNKIETKSKLDETWKLKGDETTSEELRKKKKKKKKKLKTW